MVKLNPIVFSKLAAQAEEAKERGMVKLAEDITATIGPEPASESMEYSYAQLQDDVARELWKAASHVMAYYNVESVDAEKVQLAIAYAADQVIDELGNTLNVQSVTGPLEPKVPGEIK